MIVSLLSEWLRWPWVAIYAAAIMIHLSHAISVEGRQRAWHTGHIVMSVGMTHMFLPQHLKAVSQTTCRILFAVVVILLAIWLLRAWISRRAVNLLWVILLLDMLAMVYMFAFSNVAITLVTVVLVVYFFGATIGWVIGWFDDDGGRSGLLPFAIDPYPCSAPTCAEPLPGDSSIAGRISLSAMAAGMAYMFVAMQTGL